MSIPIVFGWGKGTKELGAGFFHACGTCRNVRRFVVAEVSRNASLYFITVAKWSYHYLYVCPICLRGFEIPTRELAQRILAAALRDPTTMPESLVAQIAEANGQTYRPPEAPEITNRVEPRMIQETVSSEKVEQSMTKPVYDSPVAPGTGCKEGSSETIGHAGTNAVSATGSIVWVACPGCDGEVGISDRCSNGIVKCPKCSTEIPRPQHNE